MNRPNSKASRRRLFPGLCLGGICVFAILAELFPPVNADSRDVSVEVLRSEIVYTSRSSPYIYRGNQSVAGFVGKIESDDNRSVLATDPEQERTLERAEEFAKQGEYRWAVVLWQTILDQSATSMVTRKNWEYVVREYDDSGSFVYQKYRSVSDEVENILANLPAAALKQYRLRYDGKAAELIAAASPDSREDALVKIVRRYFISSRGDNAAFELACRRMDRGEFLGAARLLDRVLNRYPDSEIPKDELLRRLAAAQARIGDLKAARETLAKLAKDPGQSQRWLAILKQDVEQSAQYVAAGAQDHALSWPLALGGANRRGVMKGPAAIGSERGLTELWSRQIDLGFTSSAGDSSTSQRLSERRTPTVFSRVDGSIAYTSYKSISRPYYPGVQQPGTVVAEASGYAELIDRWKQNGWMPAGQALMDGNRLYFKDRLQLVCVDTETGRLLWKSFLKNEFRQDQLSKQLAAFNAAIGNGMQPRNVLDVQVFGDHIHGEMAIANGLIFSVEARPLNKPDSKANVEGEDEAKPVTPSYGYGSSPVFHRSRRNHLTAYDAVTGKLVWHRNAEVVDGGDPNALVGFMGAPVPYGRLLVAPVSDAGVIWALGIDQKTGKTVWKTKLCDEPGNGAHPWSPVRISVDGGDAYIATGAGVVFSIDAAGGAIRWGFRYTRRGRKNPHIARRFGYGGTTPGNTLLQVVGMREDAVIPHRQALVVMASDHDRLFAINRRTGGLLWESPLDADSKDADGQTFWPEYCVGVYGDGLFVAGKRVVRRYNINGGGIEWQRKLETVDEDAPASYGRGIVTDDGVYIPVRDSILKLAHTAESGEGRVIGQYGVVLEGRQPVGNIYSDGERLYVLGPGHLSALGSIKGRLKALDRKVEAGDIGAQLERMRLRGRLGDYSSAVTDLKDVIKKLSVTKPGATADHEAIADVLVRAIADLQLSAAKPLESLQLLQSSEPLFARPFSNSQHKQSLLTQREGLVFNALETLLAAKTNPGADILLQSAGLFSSPRLLRTARRALPKIVNATDRDRLLAAAAGRNVETRRLAIAGLSGFPDKKTALPPLKKALKDPEVSVRIDAAVALAGFDDRDGLPVLVDLLESVQLDTRISAIRYLSRMTGERFEFLAYDTAEHRVASVKRWREWLKGEGRTARLKPPGEKPDLIGHLLVADPSRSRVVEYDKNRKVINQATFAGASAVARLPNGHWWAASYSTSRVAEFDARGNQLRSINCAKWGQPYSLHITESGHILTAMYSQNRVVELDRDGKYIRDFHTSGYATDARRLDNGNTLVAVYRSTSSRSRLSGRSSGELVEYDSEGKVVRTQSAVYGPWSVQRLESGNTLVAEYDTSRVTEYDGRGTIVWSKTGLPNPLHAERDEKGNTLIIHSGGLCEVDRKGQVLWQISGSGMRRAIRF